MSQSMQRQELNGWLVYSWGQTLKVAFIPSAWETELVAMILRPVQPQQGDTFSSALMEPDLSIDVETIRKLFGFTVRRAEGFHSALLDAIGYFYELDEEDADMVPSFQPVIPITAV